MSCKKDLDELDFLSKDEIDWLKSRKKQQRWEKANKKWLRQKLIIKYYLLT